jgi:hypothetical protein
MNGRVRAIGSGLLATVASVAVVGVAAAAADGGPTRAPAATASGIRTVTPAVDIPPLDPAVAAKNQQVAVARVVAAVNARRWYEAVAAQQLRDQAEANARAARRASRSSSGGGGNVLDCIRHRESRGQYDAVNGSSGAAGAYQFMPGTWNNTARAAGRSDLVGVNPAAASPADQDAMAQRLLAAQGLGPWGGGCG